MKILVFNAGSSTLKFSVTESAGEAVEESIAGTVVHWRMNFHAPLFMTTTVLPP